jgi:class 3 adenylate cyclase
MNCPKCQHENPSDARFCNGCGQKLELACPKCGKSNPLGSKFCNGCGQELVEGAPKEKRVPEGEGERKYVTAMFSDLSGYTAMSEKLDPEEVKEITTRIFADVGSIVSRYEGFVEKYIGDAVVTLFGVPKAHEDDHLRAIKAAREIHESIDRVAGQCEQKIGRRLAFHTGINTGLVVTGQVNIEKGIHGVAGDAINLASRLCGIAKPGEILASESTYSQCKGTFSFERLDPVSLKGKAEPVTSYRLVGERGETLRGLATHGLSSPLVGRSAELAAIKASVNRLLDGQGGIMSVIGEAGLGKSRLMAEIRRLYQNEHLLWLEGRTLSYSNKISYWPFREILWQYAGITELDSDIQAWGKFETKISDLFPAESNEILPYLASLAGLGTKGELGKNLARMDGDSVGKQIYLSSRRFFERLAQITPVVLIFEDLHWADESTVALIAHLFPLIMRVPVLICGISRPEDTTPASRLREIAVMDHERRYTEIRINPLSPTECTNLMENLLLIENLPSRIRKIMVQKADGNPFFLEEIMRTLIDRSAVVNENGRWRVSASIDTITIPDTVQGVIIARIDRLDEELKLVLKTASVIGRTFFYRVLRAIEDSERYRVEHALRGVHCAFHWFVQAGLCIANAERMTGQERSDWLKKARVLCKKGLKSSRSFEAHRPEARRNRGTYEWLEGRHKSARKWWSRSLAAAEERERRHEAALAHLEMGKRLNDQEHLKQAAAIFADIGAKFDRAEALRLLQGLAEGNAT